MMVNKIYYQEPEMVEELINLKKYKLGTWDHFLHYMKLICSFGKGLIMTDKGIEYADQLLAKWKSKKEFAREELFCLGFLTTEVLILRKDTYNLPLVQSYYNELVDKYNPEYEYMQNFAQGVLVERGYVMENPQHKKEIEKLFVISSHYMAITPLGTIPKNKDLR